MASFVLAVHDTARSAYRIRPHTITEALVNPTCTDFVPLLEFFAANLTIGADGLQR